MPRRCSLPGVVLALGGLLLVANGGWIWAKAQLAQLLLQHSWSLMQQHGVERKPWPWADTHAVARLRVPDLGVDQLVLAGDSGRTLAFGPGLSRASALPDAGELTLISGHRDTHFRFLNQIEPGMAVELDTAKGRWRFRISARQVVDVTAGPVRISGDRTGLLLVTCYPFDTLEPGGPLRLLVWAEPEAAAVARLQDQPSISPPPTDAAAVWI